MSKFKKRIKGTKYNNPPEILIGQIYLGWLILQMVFYSIYYAVCIFVWIPNNIQVNTNIVDNLFIVSLLAGLPVLLLNIKLKQNSRNINKYFKLTPSYFSEFIWVNQINDIKNEQVGCPLMDFLRELKGMKDKLSADKTYICYTHSSILKQLKRYFLVLESEEIAIKSLKNIQKKILNDSCKECNNKTRCKLQNENKTQFYMVKFKLK